ncbi:MAG TPA: hypothetical protein VNZ26_25645, partial [Vicinamibacterales bacterium]|nr:hypothetical protein [Vicinamibacterales bacterium]
SVAYIVRPTNSLVLFGTAVYLFVTNRRSVSAFLVTTCGWGALFVAYSWTHFHTILPDYYAATRLQDIPSIGALMGTLFSPSRGLIIYVPSVIALGAALVRYRGALRFRPVATLASGVIAAHVAVVSGFVHWWGGHAYGARLTTSIVPFLLVLGVMAGDASRGARQVGRRPTDVLLAAFSVLLCAASVAMNSVGAFSFEADKWNVTPDNIDADPDRLWSWRRPQFLAPIVEPPGPYLPLTSDGFHLGDQSSNASVGLGWAYPEGEFRWTTGRGASTVRFSLPATESGFLELNLSPYLVLGKIDRQRLTVSLNDFELATVTLHTPEFAAYRIEVPAKAARFQNVLLLRHPDAVSPRSIDAGRDHRALGMAVRTISWRTRSRDD